MLFRSAFGVSNINNVSQTQLPAESAQLAYDNSPSITKNNLNKLSFNNVTGVQDIGVAGAKLYAERNSLNSFAGSPSSVEGNIIGVKNQIGPVAVVGNVDKSAPSVFGSNSSKSSPLDKIMIT